MSKLQRFLEPTFLDSELSASVLSDYLAQVNDRSAISGITVPSFWVKKAVRDLEGLDCTVSTVVGYPHGFQQSLVKLTEAKEAMGQGALGINMVWSQTSFVSGMTWPKIEIAQLSKACHEEGCLLSVLIDLNWIRSDAGLLEIARIIQDGGADYVMLGLRGDQQPSKSRIALLRQSLSSQIGIKAFWNGKEIAQAEELILAGVDRLHMDGLASALVAEVNQ